MRVIGTVKEIWRYPVKSMAGERMQRANVGALGIYGDRGWAIRDEKAGEIRGARKLPALLYCVAKYLREPSEHDMPPAQITMPDGTTFRSDDAEAAEKLSALLGRSVTIWPKQPPTERDFLRRGKPDNPDMTAELREVFGRLESEPPPDLSTLPAQILKFTSPFGTFFDAFPFHVLTTASLSALADINPGRGFRLAPVPSQRADRNGKRHRRIGRGRMVGAHHSNRRHAHQARGADRAMRDTDARSTPVEKRSVGAANDRAQRGAVSRRLRDYRKRRHDRARRRGRARVTPILRP